MNFNEALSAHVSACEKMIADYFAANYSNLTVPRLEVRRGKKYAKLVRNGGVSDRSVFAFVDMTTGDIFKPASWAAPAKHARGNIFADDCGLSCMTVYGPQYLR